MPESVTLFDKPFPLYPQEHVHKLIVGNPLHHIGMVTLWTPVSEVAKNLSKANYCIIGQLVTKSQGISAIIRNCLLHGRITDIIITGNNKTGTQEALIGLCANGVDEHHHIIGIDHAMIEPEIPLEAIELFRANVRIHVAERITDALLQSIHPGDRYADPHTCIYPDHIVAPPQSFPWAGASHTVRAETIADAWIELLHAVRRFGIMKQSRHGMQQELLHLVAVITREDPDNLAWSEHYHFTREDVEKYIPEVASGRTSRDLEYTYGSRIFAYTAIAPHLVEKIHALTKLHEELAPFTAARLDAQMLVDALEQASAIDQIDLIIRQLRKDKESRACYVSLWNPSCDPLSPNPPCIDMLNFLVQDNVLNLAVWIRSNDVMKAWPMNAIALRVLQSRVANALGLGLGSLITNAMSGHVYAADFDATDAVLKHRTFNPLTPDPAGNIVITTRDHAIVATHTAPNGTLLNVYTATAPARLLRELARDNAISSIAHALDIGAEIQKAYIAVKKHILYTQDKELILDGY